MPRAEQGGRLRNNGVIATFVHTQMAVSYWFSRNHAAAGRRTRYFRPGPSIGLDLRCLDDLAPFFLLGALEYGELFG